MDEILISVVTIVFNGEKFIERCLKSVINQKTKNIQYILIDGKSTDNTMAIVEKYKDNIDVIISEKDNGISDAFNKGVALAKGKLVSLLNCDDYYQDGILVEIIEYYKKLIIENNIGQYDLFVIHGNIKMFTEKKTKVYTPSLVDNFIFQMPIFHPTCFCSRTIYEKYKFKENIKVAMDYELMCRVYADNAKFFYFNKIVTNMFKGGISNTMAITGFKEVMQNSIKILNISPSKAYIHFIKSCCIYTLVKMKNRIF